MFPCLASSHPPAGLDGLPGGGGAVDEPFEAHLQRLSCDPTRDLQFTARQEVDPTVGPLAPRRV